MDKEIWDFVQNDPQYKDKTALVFTTDHGRGDKVTEWTSHGNKFEGSSAIYFAAMGPKLKLKRNEIESQLYQNNLKQWQK
jgi:arylsulfatase A-like enzyme